MPAKKKTSKKTVKKTAKKAAARKKVTGKTKNVKKAAANQRSVPKVDLRTYINELNRRAFEIYQQKGATHGHDWDDWFQAEKEVKKKFGIKQ